MAPPLPRPAYAAPAPLPTRVARAVRSVEWLALAVAALAEGALVARLGAAWLRRPDPAAALAAAASVPVAYLFVDFVSGLVHWFGDTGGDASTPVFGPLFFRTFVEHHADALAITRHGAAEINGTNAFLIAPFIAAAHLPAAAGGRAAWVLACWMASLAAWGLVVNQAHCWAHAPAAPPFVRWLQRRRVLLPPRYHEQHHRPPFRRNYCVLAGRCDPIVARLVGGRPGRTARRPRPTPATSPGPASRTRPPPPAAGPRPADARVAR
jgi:ubiquitin-conjugating enzyme E2 variant